MFQLKAHRIILSASSNYFREKLKGNNDQLAIDCNEVEMLQILEFIYTGKTLLEIGRLESFLMLCTKLHIKGLQETTEFTTEVEKLYKDMYNNTGFITEVESTLPDLLISKLGLEDKEQTKKGKNLLDFPAELVIKILSYISTSDLLNNVARTSKHFNELTKDPACHLSISLSYNVDKSSASKFLNWAHHIQELYIFTFQENIFELRKDFPPTMSVPFCDEILASVSMHTDLRVVNIEGMKVRGSCLNSLVGTKFYENLSQLGVDVEEDPIGFQVTASALCSTGKLRQLELNGIKQVDPRVITNMAVSCNKLEKLKTDCPLTNPDAIHIFKAHKSSLKSLMINDVEITDELIEAQSECINLENLGSMFYPLFTKLKNFKQMNWLNLDCKENFSSDLLERALFPGALPSLVVLLIRTEKDEDKLFAALSKACPLLKSITIYSNNQASKIDVFRQLFTVFKLYFFALYLNHSPSYSISDIFDGIDMKELVVKLIRFNFEIHHRREAKKLLRQIPTLEAIANVGCLYVRSGVTIKRSLFLEKHTIGIYNQIHSLELD